MLSIRVLVASPIRSYREGLEGALRELPELTLVGNAGSAAQALEQTRKLTPDVALLDMDMSGAFSVAKALAHCGAPSKIVALGIAEDETQVLSCAQIGIAGYVMRDGSMEDVVGAIKAAACGEVHCSPKIVTSLLKRIAAMAADRSQRSGTGALTEREAQILKLVQKGMSNKMISRTLGIQITTVKNHVHSILLKLGVSRRTEAVALLHSRDRHL